MAVPVGRFSVEPRLIQILGAQYRSTEEALKELVVNAWDADASRVDIMLPMALMEEPISIRDDGYGMTPAEIATQFLRVAYDRRKHQGLQTRKGRTVRGHRGIGKFAGLIAAEEMVVTTVARGQRTRLVLNRAALEGREGDLETAELPLISEPTDECPGTVVELLGLRQTFAHPLPEKLAAILLREFGPRDDFVITIDGNVLTPDAVQGVKIQMSLPLPDAPSADGSVWMLDAPRAVAEAGVVLRVDGRAIGPPTYFGLEADRDVPRSLLNRVYGELNANHLVDDVTADWGTFIENSRGFQALQEQGATWLKSEILAIRDREVGTAQDDFIQSYERQLELLPASRRDLARRQLLRVFQRFYDEAADRKHAVAELVLNAMEEDEYWILVERIDQTPANEVGRLAEVLRDWGLGEVTEVVARARQRLKVVDGFERLAADPTTLELSGVHSALEANPWLVGDEYELWKSNRTLRRIVGGVADRPLSKRQARSRPDLILVGLQQRYLLIELKRPSHTVSRRDIAQAEEYRDTLKSNLHDGVIRILVMGGTVERNLPPDDRQDVRVSTFNDTVVAARARLRWLLEHLAPDEL